MAAQRWLRGAFTLVLAIVVALAALLAVVAGVVLVRRVATAWQGPGGRSLT